MLFNVIHFGPISVIQILHFEQIIEYVVDVKKTELLDNGYQHRYERYILPLKFVVTKGMFGKHV